MAFADSKIRSVLEQLTTERASPKRKAFTSIMATNKTPSKKLILLIQKNYLLNLSGRSTRFDRSHYRPYQ